MNKTLISTYIFISSILSFSQSNFFYKGLDYGTQASYNPVYLILNGSYDIIQLQNNNRKLGGFPYYKSFKNVLNNLADPISPIKRMGWKNFIHNEVFPTKLVKENAQWWPNYQLHLIGGGMTYRALTEWYEYNSFPAPEFFSIATTAGYHFLNEVIENGDYTGDNTDAVADIYIFDVAGILLFSNDAVCNFFSKELNLSDWSLQPSIGFNDWALHNNGQYFSIKWQLPFSEKLSLFYYFGLNGLMGGSYKYNDSSSISLGIGLRAENQVIVNQEQNKKSVSLTWNAGIFYDINNSLLTSLFICGLTDYRVNLNIYPGLLKVGNFSPGLWIVGKKDGNVLFGISTIYLPGISFY